MATRMQQRRGTAAQWTSANPVLGAGEIGFETDTGKFKIGNGTNTWANLTYFSSLESILDGAPATLDTLNELAAAINDNPNFYTTVTDIASDVSDLNTAVSGNTTAIANVSTAVSNLTTDLGDAETDIQTLTNDLSGLTTTVTNQGTSISNLDTEVGNLETTVASHTTDISALLSDVGDLQTDKAPINAPTFTGIVVLPNTTSIGDVDGTEISHLNGVTSAIQTQLDGKLASSTASSTYAPISSPTFTGTVTLPSDTSIGNVSSTELGYLNNVTSAIQTQLDAKAPTASPTFTGTVSGITATMVGLGNVDNTSDANKPVSTATQTALDGKLSLSGGTMTGDIVLAGAPTQALHPATKAYADSIAEGLHIHEACVAATTANVNLSTDLENGDVLDGVTLVTGNRVLVKNQTTTSQNGIYVVQASGAAVRATDFDAPAEVDGGDFVFVTGGTVNNDTGWVQTSTGMTTIGTDPITFTQFAGAGTVTAGTNISVSGNQVSTVNNPTFSGLITASSGVAFSDGTQTLEGVPSRTPISQQTGAYNLSTGGLSLRDTLIEVSHTGGSAVQLTIPADSTTNFPVGTSIDVVRTNTGGVTIAGAGGVTVNGTPGLTLRAQWSSATLFKRAANTWLVMGDLTA